VIPISRPLLGDEEKAAVLEVIDSGQLVQGPRVRQLEERFEKLVGVPHAIATSSGTTALHLALLAHGVGPGDEVITSPFSFVATANAILYVGAVPVFGDIDELTFNLDPRSAEHLIGPRTRAIMPVHLYGQTADMQAFVELARAHNLALIEDSAQAVGATYRGQAAGSFGTGVFSLYATKNVTAGEGGVITTADEEVASKACLLRSHGMRERYRYEILGYNHRLSDLHAAIGLVQLTRLEEFTAQRRRNAAALSKGITRVRVPRVAADRDHVWHQYTVRTGALDRDETSARLVQQGIGNAVFYPKLLDEIPHVRAASRSASHPVADAVARDVLSLPVHPALSAPDIDRIIDVVNTL
jgi:dTDP-4-amino-4,6-dideoxygalactose transaminase